MTGGWLAWTRGGLLLLGLFVGGATTADGQSTDEISALNNQVEKLYGEGKYAEALEVAKRSLVLAEKGFGPEHPRVGVSLKNLALMYHRLGRYAEPEALYRRSIAIHEKKGPEHPELATSLSALALFFNAQGRYAEAEPLYKRSLVIVEKALGPEHRDVALLLNAIAELHRAQGRYAETESLYKRSLAIVEKAVGPEHPDVAHLLNNLAELHRAQGRYVEAEPLYKRSLSIREKALGPEHPSVAQSLNNIALLHQAQGRHAEAERLYKDSLVIVEKALGSEHLNLAQLLGNLAGFYQERGRYAEAEPLYKRSIAIREKVQGAEHPTVASSLTYLADLHRAQGRYAEAEPLYRRSLAIGEKVEGTEHPTVAHVLNNFALLRHSQGRYAEAEALHKRSLGILEKARGADHPSIANSVDNLALLHFVQGRYAEAEPLFKRGLALREKALGPEHLHVGTSLNNLADLYSAQGRYAEAEPLYTRSAAIVEKVLGVEHPIVASSLNNVAQLRRAQGRYAEAEPLYQRSLAMREKVLGPEHPALATSLDNLARLSLNKHDLAGAAEYWSKATAILQRRTERGLGSSSSEATPMEALQRSWYFAGLVKATFRLTASDAEFARTVRAMFETAQWGVASEAAASLAQMAARSAKESPNSNLAALVRERQDLINEWQSKDKLLIAAMSEPADRRNALAEKEAGNRLAVIDARLVQIGSRLAKDFPDYAALASPRPISVADVKANLQDDEALVLFFDTPVFTPLPEESFVWVVTKSDGRWVRSNLGTPALKREVAALRCGLDATAWNGEGAKRCAELLKSPPDKLPSPDDPLPFDHARAHALYKALFGEVADLIKGKHLLLVPSGPLTQLPFQVLVTEPPTSDDHRKMRWLARDHALTVLPAVSSLKALRRVAKPSAATRPMIGIGNPLLDGDQGDPQYSAYYKKRAALARASQSCPETPLQRIATLLGVRRGIDPIATRGGLADLAHLKAHSPLPETAKELCDVAESLKVDRKDIWLGARATEREIKRLSMASDATRLANYRIVHFATHGTLAGQLRGTSEPGLILTPPETATEEDDGYLSAGEIAALKLDADWVILSACNTASGAGGDGGAEALSGLARAFFYAQARALLVSHWEVNSDATVKLITAAVGAISRDKSVGRAEALRRAMLAMIDTGMPSEAHPAYWSPFVLVGEGAAAK